MMVKVSTSKPSGVRKPRASTYGSTMLGYDSTCLGKRQRSEHCDLTATSSGGVRIRGTQLMQNWWLYHSTCRAIPICLLR